MKVIYIGAGFVGICSAAVAADSGHDVLVYDIDEKRIAAYESGDRERINSVLYEEGLNDLLLKNKERLTYTTNFSLLKAALDLTEVIIICVPTPEKGETGETNLEYYNNAIDNLIPSLLKRNNGEQSQYLVLINKSTVPIDTADILKEKLAMAGVKKVGIAANPEFLAEGKAISGSLKPDRVVVGAWEEKDFDVMRRLYERFYNSPTVKYIEVNPKEAAAGKLLANFYLFNKLAVCYDVAGRLAESYSDIQFEKLRQVISTDERIGSWGFFDSLYAGGSCFIKDSRSLAYQIKTAGELADVIDGTYKANERQLSRFIDRYKKEAGEEWKNKKVVVLGLSYKRDTNDVRSSPSLKVVANLLQEECSVINLYDPMSSENFKKVFPPGEKIKYCNDIGSALENIDCVIISTDWPEFRELGDKLLTLPNRPVIMDGRRILQHKYSDLQQAGFSIIAVGSPFIKGKN